MVIIAGFILFMQNLISKNLQNVIYKKWVLIFWANLLWPGHNFHEIPWEEQSVTVCNYKTVHD